jgi:hypothetical protein
VLDLSVQLKDAENQRMTASRTLDSKSDWQKVKLKLKQRLKLPGGEGKTVPAEDGRFENQRPFEAGKFHHLSFLEHWRTNLCKMAEVNRDPEVFLLDHVKDQIVHFVKVVTEVLIEGLNFECVQ